MADTSKVESKGRFPHLDMMTTGLLIFSGIALCAAQASGWVAGVGVAVIIFLSAGSVGAAFGFLFAVPRLVVLDAGTPADPPTAAAAGGGHGPLLRSNTNLERISDWLTTMLVGVGLSQAGSIGEALYRFRLFLADTAKVFVDDRGVRSAGILPAVGPMVLIVGLVMGFLTLYLYTRVILSGSFKRVEDDLNARAIEKKPVTGDARDALIGEARSQSAVSNDPDIEKIAGGQDPSVGDGLNMMLNRLYQPDSYDRVIELAETLSQSPATKSGYYWFYLAAALGQKHRARRLAGADQAELSLIRAKAFDAAGQAIALRRAFADRLWEISDPQHADDDLADFRNDPEFRRLVGQPIR